MEALMISMLSRKLWIIHILICTGLCYIKTNKPMWFLSGGGIHSTNLPLWCTWLSTLRTASCPLLRELTIAWDHTGGNTEHMSPTEKTNRSLEAKVKRASLIREKSCRSVKSIDDITVTSPYHTDGVDINLLKDGSHFIYNLSTNRSFSGEEATLVNHTLKQLGFNFLQNYILQNKAKNLKKGKDTESLLYLEFKVYVLLLSPLHSEILVFLLHSFLPHYSLFTYS